MNANEQSPKRERGVRAPANSREPGASKPVAGKRVAGEPVASKPVAGKRVAGKPVASKRVAGEPVAYALGSDCGAVPLAYLITFTTYGTWLHGDVRGSVDRDHNVYRTPYLGRNQRRQSYEKSGRKAEPVTLGNKQRDVVRRTIAEVCAHREWDLHELNVRTNHVHAVVWAPCTPERVMNDFKSWATRRLREGGLCDDHQSPWTEHGSTRYLWKPVQLAAACRYVLDGQGPDL